MGDWMKSGSDYFTSTNALNWPGEVGNNLNYVNLWKTAYADMIRIKSQQEDSRLQGSVEPETIRGKELVFDCYKPVVLTQRERGQAYGFDPAVSVGNKEYAETETERRQVTAEFFEYAELFDPRDESALERSLRPDGSYARNVVAAFNRKKDEVILEAFDATVTRYGGGVGNFAPSAAMTAAGTTAGTLTVDDLIAASVALRTNASIAGPPTVGGPEGGTGYHIALHPQAIGDLLSSQEVTSADYNTVRALMTGDINTFMGFTFHEVPTMTATVAYCYHSSGMIFGMNQDMVVRFDEIPERGYSLQAFHSMGLAAMRTDEGLVYKITAI
jgi:hypothetical protein